MSRLKINYHKSEVVVFGVDEETKTNIANMLNCARGVLPLKYLDFPISNRKLKVEAFSEIVEKMRKKLQPWKGKHLTSEGASYFDQLFFKQHACLYDEYVYAS
jgi:hypothetical protein